MSAARRPGRAPAARAGLALWLAGIVLLSVGVRIALARRIVAPWIMIDELIYSELAKSFAAHGQFLVRGVPSRGYGIVYPILIAPAWRLFGAVPSVYVAAKAINSVLMSLAAIPAYLLARRLLPARLALVVAALTVMVPEMLYTGMIMTENAFYPIFVAFCLLLVLTLEAPTARRQIGLLVLFALAYETRAQAVALLPALATAPVLLAALQREPLMKGLRRFATLYAILGAGVVVALAATAARGRSPLTLLGAYDAATSSTYTVGGVSRFILYHLAGLDLYLGIVPFAALLAVWFTPRAGSPARSAFAVASFSIALWLIPEVSAFASQTSVQRIEERNMFYLAPFAFVALLALARATGSCRAAARAALAAAGVAGVLPFFIPFTSFIGTSAVSDTFALLPWWWVQDHWITLQQVRYAAFAVALAGAALFVLVPRRYALVLPALVAVYFVATAAVVDNGRHGIHLTSVGSLYSGTHETHPDWIDRAVGAHASVVVLWDGSPTLTYTVWEDEFFNRSVGAVYDLDGAWEPDPLPEQAATRSQSGVLLSGGRPIDAQYVLAHGSLALGGRLVAADPVGVDLYRVDGPIVLLTHIAGLYPNDTWSVGGAPVSYQRVECGGGRLAVTLDSDAQLFHRDADRRRARGGPGRGTYEHRRRRASACSRCRCAGAPAALPRRLHGRAHAMPARVERGSSDTRRLGAHFLEFQYFRR